MARVEESIDRSAEGCALLECETREISQAPSYSKPKTDLGKTFKKLKHKQRFQEFMDVAADVANGCLLIYQASEFALLAGIVMGLSLVSFAVSLVMREWIDDERLKHL